MEGNPTSTCCPRPCGGFRQGRLKVLGEKAIAQDKASGRWRITFESIWRPGLGVYAVATLCTLTTRQGTMQDAWT